MFWSKTLIQNLVRVLLDKGRKYGYALCVNDNTSEYMGYMQKKNSTLKDVARVAGVSTATVARVLYDKGYIASDTRKLVEAAIQETGYRVNVVARNLRMQRTVSIGHILNSIIPNPFFAGVALGAEQEAMRNGWSILMINVQGDARRERLGVETLIKQRAAAILFTTPVSEANVRLALESGMIVVQVERPTSIPSHVVTVDNYTGSVEAVEHLIALGHRNIAFVGGDPRVPGADKIFGHYIEEERLAGYLDTLRNHHIPLDESLITLGQYYSLNEDIPCQQYQSLQHIFQRANRPTAVFVTSDMLATCVLQELYARHLRVPEDVSIIGFDDTYAPYLAPPLTTVSLPMIDIGKAAVHLVLKHTQEQETGLPGIFQQVKLSTHLVSRSSTGPVN